MRRCSTLVSAVHHRSGLKQEHGSSRAPQRRVVRESDRGGWFLFDGPRRGGSPFDAPPHRRRRSLSPSSPLRRPSRRRRSTAAPFSRPPRPSPPARRRRPSRPTEVRRPAQRSPPLAPPRRADFAAPEIESAAPRRLPDRGDPQVRRQGELEHALPRQEAHPRKEEPRRSHRAPPASVRAVVSPPTAVAPLARPSHARRAARRTSPRPASRPTRTPTPVSLGSPSRPRRPPRPRPRPRPRPPPRPGPSATRPPPARPLASRRRSSASGPVSAHPWRDGGWVPPRAGAPRLRPRASPSALVGHAAVTKQRRLEASTVVDGASLGQVWPLSAWTAPGGGAAPAEASAARRDPLVANGPDRCGRRTRGSRSSIDRRGFAPRGARDCAGGIASSAAARSSGRRLRSPSARGLFVCRVALRVRACFSCFFRAGSPGAFLSWTVSRSVR